MINTNPSMILVLCTRVSGAGHLDTTEQSAPDGTTQMQTAKSPRSQLSILAGFQFADESLAARGHGDSAATKSAKSQHAAQRVEKETDTQYTSTRTGD